MNKKLTQGQRLIAAIVYLIAIGVSFSLLGGNLSKILDSGYDESIWFYSGVLLIIMGQYVTEPFFSTPADSLANSLTLVFALLTVNSKDKLIGYNIIFAFSICIIILSIIAILCKDKNNKFSNVIYIIVKNIGTSKFIYSVVFLSSSYSYFANDKTMPLFIISVAIWICIVFLGLVECVLKFLYELKDGLLLKEDSNFLGYAVKCNSSESYTIQLDKSDKYISSFRNDKKNIVLVKADKESYSFGIVVICKTLLDNLWVDVSLICDDKNAPIKITILEFKKMLHNMKISEKIGASRSIDLETINCELKEKIKKCKLYTNFNNLIGYIEQGSNINTINFSILKINNSLIKEGSIISTTIYGVEVLYQIINGLTKEERYDSNSENGYICGMARKLGVYDYVNNQLSIVKWVPSMGEKVYLHISDNKIDLKNIADTSIGRLPETDMRIPILDINSLVTHNTAVLGILGVGKSCLTFELIKKITNNKIKAVCIDITNQYCSKNGLFSYIPNEQIINDISAENLLKLEQFSHDTGAKDKPADWGNVKNYRLCLRTELNKFLNNENNVLVFNPDNHSVTKPASQFNITELVELSVVEKTRIISEVLLELCMEKGQSDFARCSLIYEEAHSLVPERNSIANSGDDRAANGTAKVILQGRKYGLGCIIVTQRTANVTKSILNQCNTIFALRVFDDTSKSFLENYIGKDYSDTLPTLEERHAIAIGKALKLKQPVIIQLNDMKYHTQNCTDSVENAIGE